MRFKKLFHRLIMVSGATALAVVTGSQAFAKMTVNYGVQPNPDSVFIAKELGYLSKIEKEFDIEFKLREFSYGAPENQAMAAGSLQIASAGMGPAVIAASRLSATLVAINILEQTGILIPIDSPVTSVCELKGKTVAYPGDGSQQYPLLLKALHDCGLTKEDITLFKSSGPNIPLLVEQKSVDAGITWDPSVSVGLASGKTKLLAKADQIMPIMGGHYVGNGIYVANKFMNKYPDITQAIITANVKAINYILCHPQKAAEIWSRQIHIPVKTLMLSMKKGVSVYSLNVIPTEETMGKYTKFLKDAGILKKEDSAAIDGKFAEKALKDVQKNEKVCMMTGPDL